MKNMQQVVNLEQKNIPAYGVGSQTSLGQETAYDINEIFKMLKAIFPTFKNTYPDDESLKFGKKVWVKALLENHITSYEQIKVGMRKARASGDFMPSPGKFVAWCKPTAEDLGLPSKEDAYSEVIANFGEFITAEWSHQAVFKAAKKATSHALKTLPEKDSRALYYRNYAIMVELVMNDEDIHTDTPKAITTEPERRTASREFAQAASLELKKMVGLV